MKKILLGLLLGSFMLQAADNLNFSGTLIDPVSCVINENKQIEIDFDKVAIDKIDGNNYKQLIGLNIICQGQRDPTKLSLIFNGTASSFNPAAIETDVEGLAIEFLQDGKPLEIGKAITVPIYTMPLLLAVPVKKAGAALPVGAFEAWATVEMDYL